MKWKNEITRLLDIRYPVIQAPMFGVTTPEMVAAAARADSLGSLALGDLPADKCYEAIARTKQLTNSSFAVNIFVHDIPNITEELEHKYQAVKKFIENLADQNHLHVSLPEISEIKTSSYQDQIEVIIAAGCKILSFTFGNLDCGSIEKLKSNGVLLIGTCTSVNEALILEQSGIDVICVQGIEAGGHRGSFSDGNILEIGGLSLLSRVYERVDRPLIYAGGIYNARTLIAAKTMGAQGIQIGSLLLASQESDLEEFEKKKLKNLAESELVLTKSFSGRYARGIKNLFVEQVEAADQILPYPFQNKLTNELRKAAKAANNPDFVGIWAGQSITGYSRKSTFEIISELVSEAEMITSKYNK